MPRRIRYKPNNSLADGMGGFLRSEQMRDVTADVAGDVARLADATAPPPSEKTDPDRVKATYHVNREAGLVKVSRNLRVAAEVYSSDEGAERAEYGSRGSKRYRTLGRAGSQIGEWRSEEL